VLQALLETDADRVIPSPRDPALYTPMRARIHELIRGNAELFARYLEVEEPTARQLLEAGRAEAVERSRWLTKAGFDASLMLARGHLIAGRFEAARLAIEALGSHPDASEPERIRQRAEHARAISAYIARSDVREWAKGLSDLAGIAGPLPAAIVPPPTGAPAGRGLLDPGLFSLGTGEIPTRPLQSDWITPRLASETPEDPDMVGEGGPEPFESELPFVMPVIAGDLAFVSDGFTVRAFDRLTLTEVWSSTADRRDPGESRDGVEFEDSGLGFPIRGLGRQLEDSTSPAVRGGVVVAPVGLASNRTSLEIYRIRGLDARSGETLWSVPIPDVGTGNDGAGVRGSIVIDGDTVVVGIRRFGQIRRLVSVALVGLDLRDGRVRWTRLIGSAGTNQRGLNRRAADGLLLDRGVIYRTDEVGLVAAIESATGRPVWVRTLQAFDPDRSETLGTWSSSLPVIQGTDVVVLSPDRRTIYRLDAASGAVKGSRDATFCEDARYLVAVGDWLAVVGPARVAFVPLADLEGGAAISSDVFTGGQDAAGLQMVGRAFASDGSLAIPVRTGLVLINPTAPQPSRLVPLEHSGNALALDGDLLVAGPSRLHSYLGWDRAEGIVRARMQAQPDDPAPALALAQLAHRAGKHDQIVPAIEAALGAIARNPSSELVTRTAPMVNDTLKRMIAGGVRVLAAAPGEAPDPAAIDRMPEAGGAPPIRDLAVLGALVDQLQRVSDSDADRLASLFLGGSVWELRGEARRALDAYQEVLASPRLSAAAWVGDSVQLKGEAEATRRTLDVVRRAGIATYGPYDQEALRQRPDATTPEKVLALVRRYPAASQNADLLAGLARERVMSGELNEGGRLLGEALESAEHAFQSGRSEASTSIGSLAIELTGLLERQRRFAAAAQLLSRLKAQYPSVAYSDSGSPADGSAMIARWTKSLSESSRPPRISRALGPEVRVLPGWKILNPLNSRGSLPGAEQVVLFNPAERSLAMWSVGPGGGLSQSWSRKLDNEPTLLSRDSASMVIFVPRAGGAVLEKLDVISGKSQWTTPEFNSIFGGPLDLRSRLRDNPESDEIRTPMDGMVSFRDLLVAQDEQTIVLVDRAGRAAGFDAGSGAKLWSDSAVLSRVFDVEVSGPSVAFGGTRDSQRPDLAGVEKTPALQVLDARTGKVAAAPEALGAHIRWLRLTDSGLLLVGQPERVLAYDLRAGRLAWSVTEPAARDSAEAWIFGPRLFLLSRDGELHVGDLASGKFSPQGVMTSSRLNGAAGMAIAFEAGPSVIFAAPGGMVTVGAENQTVGLDPLGGITPMLMPARAEGMVVNIDAEPQRAGDGEAVRIMLFDVQTGKLLSQQPVENSRVPESLAVVDGRVLFTAGGSTFVIQADR
jgi:outer membrane protein assembly factor BamB